MPVRKNHLRVSDTVCLLGAITERQPEFHPEEAWKAACECIAKVKCRVLGEITLSKPGSYAGRILSITAFDGVGASPAAAIPASFLRRAAASQELVIQVDTPNRGRTHLIKMKYAAKTASNSSPSGICCSRGLFVPQNRWHKPSVQLCPDSIAVAYLDKTEQRL
jgi:hypothetical protein